MPRVKSDNVEAYVFRRRAGKTEFLVLQRAPNRRHLPGVWQPVTGKLDRGESAFDAARREVREETSLSPKRWWSLECPALYYDATSDTTFVLPLFVAEIGARDCVTLSDEHEAYRFVPAASAARLFLWEAQRAALAAVKREVLCGGALAKALEISMSPATPVHRPRGTARAILPTLPRASRSSGPVPRKAAPRTARKR